MHGRHCHLHPWHACSCSFLVVRSADGTRGTNGVVWCGVGAEPLANLGVRDCEARGCNKRACAASCNSHNDIF